VANSQFDERVIQVDQHTWLVAEATGVISLASYNHNFRVDTLVVANLDSIPHAFTVWLLQSGSPTTVLASGVLAAASGGVNTTEEVLSAHLPASKQALVLEAGSPVGIALAVAVTGDNLFTAVAIGGSI